MADFLSLLTSLHNQALRFSHLHLIKFIPHSASPASTCVYSQSTSQTVSSLSQVFLCAIHGSIVNYGHSLLSSEEHQHSVVLPQSDVLPLWHSYVPLSYISSVDFIPLWSTECLGGCHCPELKKEIGYTSPLPLNPQISSRIIYYSCGF